MLLLGLTKATRPNTEHAAVADCGVIILDVAGGNGLLARALVERGVSRVVLLDPKPRLSTSSSVTLAANDDFASRHSQHQQEQELDRRITMWAMA